MKKILLVAATTVVVIALAGVAFATSPTTPPTIDVNATVLNKCDNAVSGAAAPLSIDPLVGDQSFNVTSQPSIQCTKRTGASTTTITAASTNGTTNTTPATCAGSGSFLTGFTMQSTGGKTINYSFACVASVVGLGFGNATHDIPLGIAAKVLSSDALVADYDGGNPYSDTVTLTINY